LLLRQVCIFEISIKFQIFSPITTNLKNKIFNPV
jgi:hypothetical protein